MVQSRFISFLFFVVSMALFAQEKNWVGQAGLNALLNTGNSVNQTFGGSMLLGQKWDQNKVEFSGQGAYGRAKDSGSGQTNVNTKNWKTQLRYDRFITEPMSIFSLGHVGQDQIAGFDARFGGALGLSHPFYKTDLTQLKYEVGYDFTRELRKAPGIDDNIHSARTYLGLKQKISDWADFNQDVEALFNVEESEDYRINTLTSLVTKLTQSLAFQFGFGTRFDNLPVTGFKKFDTSTQAGLVVNFL